VKRVLLLKAGEVSDAVRAAVGDRDSWFLPALEGLPVHLTVLPVYAGAPPAVRVRDFDAVWTTGASASVTEGAPWMARMADLLLEASAKGVPVLGVCFGHQLLARAFGGAVERSPHGREIGTVEVELTEEGRADPLFAGMAGRVAVQTTHEDVVPALPPGARALAGNGHTALQAVAFNGHVRGVQWHPEVEAPVMRVLLEARAEGLEAEALARGEPPGLRVPRLLEALRPTPSGRQLLRNFLRHWT
jgi:GMP synthase (glutamine-hydrolysing)